jgi:hypothetical protein
MSVLCAALLGVALSAAPEPAVGLRRVAILVAAPEEREGQQLQHQLATQLASDERLALIDPTTRIADQEAGPGAAELGRKSLDEVEAAIAQVDFEGARTKAEAGLAALRAGDFRNVARPFVQLLLQLARIKRALHADDGGQAELAEALALDPSAEAPRGSNSADRRALEATRARLKASATAVAVAVESSPASGLLWVDGALRGATPLTLEGLVPGRHYFTFVAPGARAALSTEQLGSLTHLQVSGAVTAGGQALRAALRNVRDSARREPLGPVRAVLPLVGADEVLLVISTSGPAELWRIGPTAAARLVIDQAGDVLVRARQALFEEPLLADRQPPSKSVAPAHPAAKLEPIAVPAPAVGSAAGSRPGKTLLLVLGGLATAAGVGLLVASKVGYDNSAAATQISRHQAVDESNTLSVTGFSIGGVGVVLFGAGLAVNF